MPLCHAHKHTVIELNRPTGYLPRKDGPPCTQKEDVRGRGLGGLRHEQGFQRLGFLVLLAFASLGQLPHEGAHVRSEHADKLLVALVKRNGLIHHLDHLEPRNPRREGKRTAPATFCVNHNFSPNSKQMQGLATPQEREKKPTCSTSFTTAVVPGIYLVERQRHERRRTRDTSRPMIPRKRTLLSTRYLLKSEDTCLPYRGST